jgi:hypothetical protein
MWLARLVYAAWKGQIKRKEASNNKGGRVNNGRIKGSKGEKVINRQKDLNSRVALNKKDHSKTGRRRKTRGTDHKISARRKSRIVTSNQSALLALYQLFAFLKYSSDHFTPND